MKYREIAETALKYGWYILREGKGSHVIWAHKKSRTPLVIPNHGSKEINPNLAKAMIRRITTTGK